MATLNELTAYLNELFPIEAAADFDNPGMLVCDASGDKEIKRVKLVLDLTNKIVTASASENIDFIITHHPLIFGAIKNVRADNPQGQMIVSLIKNSIPCFAIHTNMDANDKMSNKVAAGCIFSEEEISEIYGSDNVFCGVFVNLKNEMSVEEIVKRTKSGLNASGVTTINDPELKVKKIFIQGGSFDEDSIPELMKQNVDCVISGEIKHHITLLLEECGISTLIAGHNATERVFMTNLNTHLQEKFPDVSFFVDLGNEKNIF